MRHSTFFKVTFQKEKSQKSQSLHATQACSTLTLQPPLLNPAGNETRIWMMAGILPVWVSRQEILHWEEEILKSLWLFFFVAFWGVFVVFFLISVSAIAQKFVVME